MRITDREAKFKELKEQSDSRKYKDEKQKNLLANKVVFGNRSCYACESCCLYSGFW